MSSTPAGTPPELARALIPLIRDYAREHDCDLIVLGTHGWRGWQLMLGSVSNAVIHGTPATVLLCRAEAA